MTLAQRIEVGLFAVEKLFHGVDDPSLARELAWIAHDGRRAKNHFIEANLRLVDSIAKHYSGRGMPIMGLVRDGNIGLVRAVEKYDFMTGYKCSTHATRWIRQAVHRGMAQPEEHAVLTMRASDIVFYMNALPPRERSILMSRFGLDGGAPQTLDQIAVVQGVTRERVRQIEKRALALLKVLRLERYLRD
ncbi:sigma factor-like helix-turn-helix DNA-binding protein [Cryobacterium sp. M96]|uniref:sigma factor-like helix-turn-helix DNA-binding protein n=1 Tax=Cryobacterium sp. M96 TaxID=2048295 RepID=UPI0013050490|nr:sigma factor-like helix-turn-helix DNA-binding protein [Cryobacterium sp. M96]